MESDDLLDRLERLEFWLQTIVKLQLAPLLEAELSDPKSMELYELTGDASAKEIAKELRCSMTTVSDAWKRWERLGLIVKEGNRYRKVFA